MRVFGEEAHAGTTPKATRKDALRDAIQLVGDLSATVECEDGLVRFDVGNFDVSPNSINTVPSRVVFTVDLSIRMATRSTGLRIASK
jgi:beta-ureidopropionase / N-carbamoyl-L-amino-acid hydrolase